MADVVLVHGPWGSAETPMPCCARLVDDAEPGLVTVDEQLVTCTAAADLAAFTESFHGGWLQLESGTLDIGLIRDVAVHYGGRWRPWKRHLHRRFVPRRVRRGFGWRPVDPAPFVEWSAVLGDPRPWTRG